MKRYSITVNGNTYDVIVEEADATGITSAPVAAPVATPVAAPKAAATYGQALSPLSLTWKVQ